MEFTYNNIKKISTNSMLFKLNYGYYPFIYYKKGFNPYLKSKTIKKLSSKF